MNVTLTFDNGPEPSVTPHVLEVLERERILATFFVLGAKLADPARRKLAEQAHAAGHWIGNHTMTHGTPLGKLTEPGAARREILDTQKLLGKLAHPDRLFRPFGGGGALGPHLLNQEAVATLKEQRMTCVLWNAIPRDFDEPDHWVERALEQCQALPWTLLVLHDLPNGAMKHLANFLERIHAAGGIFTQEFPPDCVPMRRGAATPRLRDWTARRSPR
ncbi:MAG TPA: polysaccharide deacetylase family protein [Burkholderiales bacterium]|nr:polysaccharide deacetylase family protein [Burkholderiales bacterium]